MGKQAHVLPTGKVLARLSLAIALAAGILTGCIPGTLAPSGSVKTETRALAAFQRVVLTCPGTLEVVPSKTSSLKVTADDNVIRYVSASVKNGVLTIDLKRSGIPVDLGPGATLDMELHTPSLTEIDNSGSGSVTGGPFTGTEFTIVCSGSGDVSLKDVSVVSLSAAVTGSGGVAIDGGVVGAQQVDSSGSGSFEAPGLESRVTTVRVSGSGSVVVWATEGLDATITGSGSVSYWGSPRLTEEASGSGSVKSLGPKESDAAN